MPVLVLVMTDVEGSTSLWSQDQGAMLDAMRRHHEIVHGAIASHGGWRPVDQGEGDAVFAAFESAAAALNAVIGFQRALAQEPWLDGVELRARVGVHVGDVLMRDGNLFGPVVNRCARIRGLGAGGQVLLSAAVFELIRDRLPDDVHLADLGEHRMKDLIRPERIHEVRAPGLLDGFPPLAALDRAAHNLPQQSSSFVGRTSEVERLVDLVQRERLVTITGFGGMGKTRLALQVAAELADGDGDGVWFVDLAGTDDVDRVPSAIADVLGISPDGEDSLHAVLAHLAGRRMLLVLDNLEQLLPAVAPVVARVVEAGPGVRVLATSREPIQIRGEQVWALDPLPLPSAASDVSDLASLGTYASVALLLERAAAVRRGFELTPANAAAVAAICTHLDGLPLALELAASRLRMLTPESLLQRLDHALTVLTGGSRDLPSRQQTLRATIAWSVDALDEPVTTALARLSVFGGAFDLAAAEAVIGEDVEAFGAVEVLVERSLLRVEPGRAGGEDRYRLLVTIREYAAERLLGSERSSTELRHAEHFAGRVDVRAGFSEVEHEEQVRAVSRLWPELRIALGRFHDLGLLDLELRLAADCSTGLRRWGHLDDATAVLVHALQHPQSDAVVEFELLLAFRSTEYRRDRLTDPASLNTRLIDAARRSGDPSVIATALSDSVMYVTDRETAREMFDESTAQRQRIGGSDRYAPWFVDDSLRTAVVNSPFTDRALAESLWRDRVHDPDANDRARARYYVAALLAERGEVREALGLLHPYESSVDADQIEPFGVALIRIALVGMLIRTGALDRTEAVLRRIDSELESGGLQSLRGDVEWLRAAWERAAGREEDALIRLDGLTQRTDGHRQGDAAWLLSVVLREAGRPGGEPHLRRATRFAVDEGDVNLALRTALEWAGRIADSRPEVAAELLGCAQQHRRDASVFPDVDHEVVQYDPDGVRQALLQRPDAARLRDAFELGAGKELSEALREVLDGFPS